MENLNVKTQAIIKYVLYVCHSALQGSITSESHLSKMFLDFIPTRHKIEQENMHPTVS